MPGDTLFLLPGTHLFPLGHFEPARDACIVMCEDRSLCTYVRHHKHKLVLVLAAMRHHADTLRSAGFEVCYRRLDDDDNSGLVALLETAAKRRKAGRLVHFELDARYLAARVHAFAAERSLEVLTLPNPMFMQTLEHYDEHLAGGKTPLMARYYREARKRHGILLEADGSPCGGQWSFDARNREALPGELEPPAPTMPAPNQHVRDCIALVDREFTDHPGNAESFWIPATRDDALAWLHEFLHQRFARFGPYEDALSRRSTFLYHSVLSPLMNIGLLTPGEVLDEAIAFAGARDLPLNSLEGFVRQILGWREFMRAVYHRHGREQSRSNFWGHERGLTRAWYDGTTGVPPLDDAIALASQRGWNHHIERLMVIGNLMTLSEIRPQTAYRWFMEMYADAYGWVMEPNVYGMALFSDGGLFATKPYVCGSNYLLKMSDYPRGAWCDTVDGLYWRFIDKHREFFDRNPRLRMTLGSLERMKDARRERIFAAANAFLEKHTTPSG